MAKLNEKKRDFFWLSYSDLMTSMFFVMLVLFVLVYTMQSKIIEEARIANEKLKSLNEKFRKTEEEREQYLKALEAKAEEIERIEAIDAAVRELEKGGLYEYNNSCKRFELKQDIMFDINSAVIPQRVKKQLIEAGKQLQQLLLELKDMKQVKFIVIIEGRAAKNEDFRKNLQFANKVKDLGYSRSLSLQQLWIQNGISINSTNSEIFISSSGFDGLCRYTGAEEGKNKRFIIQVIPYLIK